MANPRQFVLIHKRSFGDIVCLTALARDIQLGHPGKYSLFVDTSCPSLWDNNPYVQKLDKQQLPKGATFLKMQYGNGLREQNKETIHFAAYFQRDFKKQTQIEIPVTRPYGDLHLSPEEQTPLVSGRYWCVISGGKSDFTAKVWDTKKFQEVVDRLREQGLGVVQLGDVAKGHWHPPLNGVLNLVGRTNLRDMLRLIHHSDGVVCGVTGGMHAAAALQRPCVVIAGGREAWWWEAYTNENKGFGERAAGTFRVPHRFLHTIGLLDCCKTVGCWRNKVVPLNGDNHACLYPILTAAQPVPKCLAIIHPHHVFEAAMSYYSDNSLPPIVPVSGDPVLLAPTAQERAKAAHPHTPRTPMRVPGRPAMPATPVRIATVPEGTTGQAIEHPDVGGKFTVCVLFYGDFFDLHKRCLDSILATIPAYRMDLRVGSNAVGPRTLAMLDAACSVGTITKHYRHAENAYKYPVMREMFFDPAHPITTKWVIWFDDDTIADRNKDWLSILAQAIVVHHRKDGAHMFGARVVWTMTAQQQAVFRSRPWYRQRPFRAANGKASPNGDKIVFVAGSFWAITHEAIIAADIPDLGTGLTHNGGDWQIGEQLYQAGFDAKMFNHNKQFVHSSSVPRRGVTMPTPGRAVPVQPSPVVLLPTSPPKVAPGPAIARRPVLIRL